MCYAGHVLKTILIMYKCRICSPKMSHGEIGICWELKAQQFCAILIKISEIKTLVKLFLKPLKLHSSEKFEFFIPAVWPNFHQFPKITRTSSVLSDFFFFFIFSSFLTRSWPNRVSLNLFPHWVELCRRWPNDQIFAWKLELFRFEAHFP